MAKKEIYDIAGEVRGETELAYKFYDGKTTVWLAKSLVEWDSSDKTMTMPEWVAKDKGLI